MAINNATMISQQKAYDAVVLNGVNLQTNRIGTDKLEGLGDPSPVFESGQRVQAHGVWSTTAYHPGRMFSIGGYVIGESLYEADQLWRLVQAAASHRKVPLTITVLNKPMTYMVHRASDFNVQQISPYAFRWSCTLQSDDPYGLVGGQPTTPTTTIPPALIPAGYSLTGGAATDVASSPYAPSGARTISVMLTNHNGAV